MEAGPARRDVDALTGGRLRERSRCPAEPSALEFWALEPSVAESLLRDRGWLHLTCGPTDPDELVTLVAHVGQPVPADGLVVAWPVTPRSSHGYGSTFSETTEPADLHTDAQYASRPDDAFVLHAEVPASCGGGSNLVLHGDDLLDRLVRSAPSALRTLESTVVPFKVPHRFAGEHGDVVWGRVLEPDGRIRWRLDTLRGGFDHLGLSPTPAIASAIAAFAEAVVGATPTTVHLVSGAQLVVDNRRCLHGRTAFDDLRRLLWRIRWTWR